MLTQHYFYYVWKILSAGMLSLPGLLSILLLIAAIVCGMRLAHESRVRLPALWLLLVGSAGMFLLAFNGGIYSFDEKPETLEIAALQGEPTCGTAWSGWIRGGYGMGNPCPQGCYRGKILNKQMRMRGLPPWPEQRREMQCWARTGD